MPDLVSRLAVELRDGVSGPAKTASRGLKGFEGEVKSVRDKLKALGDFKIQLGNFKDSRAALNDAKKQIADIAKARADAWRQIREFDGVKMPKSAAVYGPLQEARKSYNEIDRAYRAAVRTVKEASREFDVQASSIKKSVEATKGLNFNSLIGEEKRLLEAARATNDEIARHGKIGPKGVPAPGSPDIPNAPRRGSRVGSGKPKTSKVDAAVGGAAAATGWNLWQSMRDGAMLGFDFQEASNRMMSQGGADWKTAEELAIFSKQYAKDKGYVTPQQAVQILTEYMKAGVSPSNVKGMLPHAAGLAQFGGVDPLEAVDAIVATAAGFRMDMKSPAGAEKTSKYIADNIAMAAASTRGGVDDFRQGLKYTSGFASMQGISPQQTLAYLMTLVESGQSGAEAGTALRHALVTAVKPTIDARQALAELGISITDYETDRRATDAGDLVAGMENRFGSAKGFKKLKDKSGTTDRLSKAIEENVGATTDEMSSMIADFFIKEYDAKSAQDRGKVVSAARRYMESQINELDFEALMTDLQDKKITPGQSARIFQSKHGSRMMAIMRDKRYQEFLAMLQGMEPGEAERRADIQMGNGVGVIRRGANMVRAPAIELTQGVMRVPGAVADGWSQLTKQVPSPPAQQPRAKFAYSGMNQAAATTETETKDIKITADTSEADASIAHVEGSLANLSGQSASPKVMIEGSENAMALLQSVYDMLMKINNTTVQPKVLAPSVSNIQSDIGPAGGGGW